MIGYRGAVPESTTAAKRRNHQLDQATEAQGSIPASRCGTTLRVRVGSRRRDEAAVDSAQAATRSRRRRLRLRAWAEPYGGRRFRVFRPRSPSPQISRVGTSKFAANSRLWRRHRRLFADTAGSAHSARYQPPAPCNRAIAAPGRPSAVSSFVCRFRNLVTRFAASSSSH